MTGTSECFGRAQNRPNRRKEDKSETKRQTIGAGVRAAQDIDTKYDCPEASTRPNSQGAAEREGGERTRGWDGQAITQKGGVSHCGM